MAVRGLEETTSRLDQAKKLGGVVVIAAFLAALVVGALILSGLFGFVPAPDVRLFGFTIPRTWTAFVGAFTMALGIVVGYVYFAQLIRNTAKKAYAFWLDLPLSVQAVVLGLQAGLLAALSLYVTDRYVFGIELLVLLAAALAVTVITTVATLRITAGEWTLREWTRTVYTSVLIAGVIAALASFAFAGVIPGYTKPALFFLVWLVGAYLLYRRRETLEDSVISRLLTRTGYAQLRQVDTVPVSVATGTVLAVVVGVLVGLAGTRPAGALQRAVFSFLLVWLAVTVATSVAWPTRERLDLVIEDIRVRRSTDLRELTIRNIGDRPVDLTDAKIKDAHNSVYHIGINVTLSAGEAGRFEIPEGFELASHEPYGVVDLPFELSLTRAGAEPRIITRNGRLYVMLWIDQHPSRQPADPEGAEATPGQGGAGEAVA